VSLEIDIRLRLGSFDLRSTFRTGGGITALFGPSGSGKTLTLRCIAGLARPDGGTIVLDGRVLFDAANRTDVSTRDRSVGYVFQQYALFPHLSVERNIAYGLTGRPPAERAARVEDLLRIVGLPGIGDRKPSELSGGQQQRVAIARALAPEPKLLLLDEPFAAVDQRARRRLRAEFLDVHARVGTPMLLVTHDIEEVRQLADSLVLLNEGRVLRTGPTTELLTPPFDIEVADLLE
jgi:molybdate transport system ATP-binding protein